MCCSRETEEIKGAVASQSDLAIAGYDKLTADEIVAKLSELSQPELAKVDAYRGFGGRQTPYLSVSRFGPAVRVAMAARSGGRQFGARLRRR